jgi:hypothetical protein
MAKLTLEDGFTTQKPNLTDLEVVIARLKLEQTILTGEPMVASEVKTLHFIDVMSL